MEGWVDGWVDGWMDGWMGRWIDGWMDGWVERWKDGRMKAVDGVSEPGMPHSVSRSPKKIGWSITPRIRAHSL